MPKPRTGRPPDAKRAPMRDNSRSGRPFVRFVVIFALLTTIALTVAARQDVYRILFVPYLNLNASVSAAILRGFGEDATAAGNVVSAPRYTLRIERGCDAIEPLALFCAAVIAMPGAWRGKLLGVLAAAVILPLLNLIRVISLYYVGVLWPERFETFHIEVWQPLFVLATFALWAMWALRISGRPADHAAAQPQSTV